MSNVIEFAPRSESHVRRLSYDPDKQTLAVTFNTNGYRYTHADVPPAVFATMTRWSSPGSYYHSVIKKHYRLIDKQKPKEA